MISDYDIANVREIIRDGLGDWYSAHVLRFLHIALAKADSENKKKLHSIFPDECAAIYRYWGWPEADIAYTIQIHPGGYEGF